MLAPQELLNANGIRLDSYKSGRHYVTCPQCSHTRSDKKAKVLGVTIEGDSVRWGCNHCGWTGPEKGGAARGNGHDRSFVATYDYTGFQKVRYRGGHKPPFAIRHRVGNGWQWGAGGADTSVLFDNLWAIRIPATCNAHGASEPDKKPKWTRAHSEQLRGADIVVFNDNDPAGYAHANETCRLSLPLAARVCRLDLY
jgi:hypothetical protein